MKNVKLMILSYNGKVIYKSHEFISEGNNDIAVIIPNLKLIREFKFQLNNIMYIWQHSFFVKEKVVYYKHDIDGICRNSNYSIYFNIEFQFNISEIN